jgi:PIN domain nuclease of toxin-antitoxin system
VAKLVEYGKLTLSVPVADWLKAAETYHGLSVLSLTTEIIVDSTQLPGEFHKDPADQLIVATARVNGLPLMTMDTKILAYRYVALVGEKSR